MNELIDKFDRVLIFVVVYTIAFLVFFKTLNYTLPFVLAFIFALILRKPTELMVSKFKFKKSISSLITTIVFFSILLSLLGWGLTMAGEEIVSLGRNIQTYINDNTVLFNQFIDNLQKYYNNLDPYFISTIEANFSSTLTKFSNLTVSVSGSILSSIVSFLASIPYIVMVIIFTMLATYFFTKDMTLAGNRLVKLIPENKSIKFTSILTEARKMLLNYSIAYMTIIGLTFVETLIVFIVFKIKYAFLLSVVCAFFDLLPILGIGAIYIPLALIYFFLVKNYIVAVGLVISYAIVSIIRQLVEPKLVSSSLGIHPVAVLAALFIGLKADGIAGMFFCIFMVIFYNVLRRVNII
ncbi:MAG: sporulation integral membrane protein YtvI [Solirubrobacterales bacterium]